MNEEYESIKSDEVKIGFLEKINLIKNYENYVKVNVCFLDHSLSLRNENIGLNVSK